MSEAPQGAAGIGLTTTDYAFTVHTGQPLLAVLTITADFKIHSRTPMPNFWRRFWYWALLGWEWERVK